jgi:PPR repeat family/PPR repeat
VICAILTAHLSQAIYLENDQSSKIMELYDSMIHNNVEPNEFTYKSLLTAAAESTNLNFGKLVHSQLKVILRLVSCKQLTELKEISVVLLNSLINMYAKCGELEKAKMV